MTEQERLDLILEALDGLEIATVLWPGNVAVRDGMIWRGGTIVETMPTLAEARALLRSVAESGDHYSPEIAVLVLAEFGGGR